MTTAILNIYRAQRNLQTKISSVEVPLINWKPVCIVGFFIIVALLVFYAWQVNGLIEGSYLIKNYEKDIMRFSEENKKLQISFAESSFLGEALVKIQQLNFQKVTSVKYIQMPESQVQVTINR